MKTRFNFWVVAAVVLLLGPHVERVEACGVAWTLPKDHFNGVNERGYVSIWDQIGELDLGEDLKIPLIVGFESNREWISPHVGHGFILALLDSRFEQVDEGTFHMIQPDGWTTVFRRDPKNKDILGGQGGWKAEVKENTITAYASCGWKLAYRQGKISSITTPKNKVLDYLYEGGRVSEIRLDGSNVLRVKADPMSGVVLGLILGDGKEIQFSQGQRPQVQNIKGQNLIVAMSSALSQVAQSDGKIRDYTFAVDDKLNPILTMDKIRTIAWDAETKRILKDRDWVYIINAGNNLNEFAAIERKNSSKESEFWHLDNKGKEIKVLADGTRQIKEWFTSGILSGKMRNKITFSKNGKIIDQSSYKYNEKGELIRKEINGNIVKMDQRKYVGNYFEVELIYENSKPKYARAKTLKGEFLASYDFIEKSGLVKNLDGSIEVVSQFVPPDLIQEAITKGNNEKPM